jgi:hypothetical protein
MVIVLQNSGLDLFGSPREDEPAVERGSPAFAATTGPDPKGMGYTLDGIAQANLFTSDETRETNTIWLRLSLVYMLTGCCVSISRHTCSPHFNSGPFQHAIGTVEQFP